MFQDDLKKLPKKIRRRYFFRFLKKFFALIGNLLCSPHRISISSCKMMPNFTLPQKNVDFNDIHT
jgi:hypothetical protein